VDDHRLTARDSLTEEPPTSAFPPPTTPAPRDLTHPLALIDRPWPTWRLVLTLAWPALAQHLLVLTVTLSDRLLAGRFQDLDAENQLASQAAQTTANYLAWFITSYTVLVSVGSTALVAHFIGGRDRAGAVRVTHQSLLLALILGLAGSIAGLVGLPYLVRALQLHGAAADFAESYLFPLFLLLVFQVIESAGIACLVGAGDTRTGLWVLGGVAVLNLPLAWLFFYGLGPLPRLGFTGIALGTAVSHTLGGLIVVMVLLRGRAGLYLRFGQLRPDADLLRRLLRISIPMAADSLSVGVAQLWFVSIVNGLSVAASGAHGIALGWEALGYLSGAAFGTAAITLVGQNLGAGRPDQAARSGWTAFGLGCGIMSLMGVVFFALAEPMFLLFCPDPGQRPIVEEGVPVLRLIAFAMPPLASSIVFTSALRGAGDTRVPVLFTWCGFFLIRIPLAYLLTRDQLDLGELGTLPGAGLGLLGAWLAMFADLVVRGLFFLARFAGGRWQSMRV
jgi:putative MATE family efflux protein